MLSYTIPKSLVKYDNEKNTKNCPNLVLLYQRNTQFSFGFSQVRSILGRISGINCNLLVSAPVNRHYIVKSPCESKGEY